MPDPNPVPDATSYNYDTFAPECTNYRFFRDHAPATGSCTPDIAARTVAGQTVHLSDYAGQRVVLETGSVTCPAYDSGVARMNRLAERHPDVAFLVLYVREAHPGSRISCHVDRADKTARASSLSETRDEHRTVLVDDVEGTAHRALGALPNSVFVVDEDGRLVWRCTWNRPELVDEVLMAEDPTTLDLPWHREISGASPSKALRVLREAGWNTLGHILRHAIGMAAQHLGAVRLAKRALPLQQEEPPELCWDRAA